MHLENHKQMEDAIKTGDIANVERICKSSPDLVRAGWRDGAKSWVDYAMTRSQTDVVDVLVNHGADIDQGKNDYPFENALFGCLSVGDLASVNFLLERGASVDLPGIVCASVVAEKNQFELVKLLDSHGADIHEVSEGGFSGGLMNALSLAKDWGRDDIVEYLESRGCVMPNQTPQVDDNEPVTVSLAPSQQIIDHFTKTIGAPEKISLIQIVPTGIPIAIHAIPANEHHPFVTLFTTGMSDQPMNVPEGAEEYSRAELYIQLPADWKYREYEDPNWGWPQEWLRSTAQHPSQHNSWLGGPVTLVANGEPPQPLAPNTKFTTLVLLADQSLTVDDHKVWLYRMTPLYTEERQLEIDEGVPALPNAFDAHDIPMIVDMTRKNVAM